MRVRRKSGAWHRLTTASACEYDEWASQSCSTALHWTANSRVSRTAFPSTEAGDGDLKTSDAEGWQGRGRTKPARMRLKMPFRTSEISAGVGVGEKAGREGLVSFGGCQESAASGGEEEGEGVRWEK